MIINSMKRLAIFCLLMIAHVGFGAALTINKCKGFVVNGTAGSITIITDTSGTADLTVTGSVGITVPTSLIINGTTYNSSQTINIGSGTINLTVSSSPFSITGNVTINGNSATTDIEYVTIQNNATLNITGDLICDGNNHNYIAINAGNVLTAGSITMSNNSRSSGAGEGYDGGVENRGTIEATTGNITISGNSCNVENGNGVVVDKGSIVRATTGNITISGNSGESTACGVWFVGTIEATTGTITTSDNNGGVIVDGDSIVIATTGNITISGNSSTNRDGVYNGGTIEATTGNITISGNSGTDYYGVYNRGTIAAPTGTITISDNSGTDYEAVYNDGTIEATTGTITISGNSGGQNGVYNNNSGTIRAGAITISGNSGTDYYGVGNYNTIEATTGNITISGNSGTNGGIYNSGTIEATTGNITISGNSGGQGGIYNSGAIEATTGNITISDNSSTNYEAVYNGATIEATTGNITISHNSGNSGTTGYGVGNGGTIEATTGNITISHNSGGQDGVYNDGTIEATTGTITISDNSSTNYEAVYNSGTIEATTGTITISGNSSTNDLGFHNDGGTIKVAPYTGGSGGGGGSVSIATGGYYSAFAKSTLTGFLGFAAHQIQKQRLALNSSLSNVVPSIQMQQSIGFKTGTATVAVPGGSNTTNMIITVDGTAGQRFESSNAAIKDSSDADLTFSEFTITINNHSYGVSGGNYQDMSTNYPYIVVLNPANQI